MVNNPNAHRWRAKWHNLVPSDYILRLGKQGWDLFDEYISISSNTNYLWENVKTLINAMVIM